MARIRRRGYGPKNAEQRDPKYGKRGNRASNYKERKGKTS